MAIPRSVATPSLWLSYSRVNPTGSMASWEMEKGLILIDELARGNGKVIPTDKIQRIQSLDGGIISDIFIKEGQTIKKGSVYIFVFADYFF